MVFTVGCWTFISRQKKGNSKEQYRFIRRAELMIALIMQKPAEGVQQITGSNFASNLLNTVEENHFDLSKVQTKTTPTKMFIGNIRQEHSDNIIMVQCKHFP
ncbi:MAG: hypothetical protein R2831_12510 [Chitinophagaceae bacterium]